MSDFAGMEELLQDFLTEAQELLSQVDNKLVELEKRPEDYNLLNEIFRGFHTIKGGAGFLNASAMVALCHRTENLFDKLRNRELALDPVLMDVIMAATGELRDMFAPLARMAMPEPAPDAVLLALDAALSGQVAPAAVPAPTAAAPAAVPRPGEPDWAALHAAVTGVAPAAQAVDAQPVAAHPVAEHAVAEVHAAPVAPHAARAPARSGAPAQNLQKETTIRVDTARLDQVLNLSGEIGLIKNRIMCLKADILSGKSGQESLKALDEAVGQLDLMVGDLQNAVMKTRMQPIGRLFQKYPRLARDLARQLEKDVELVLSGEDTEIDKTMIEDLADPLVHLVRNAVDHGVETTEQRIAAGKPVKSVVRLTASQVGDHIYIEISDDGRGMRPETIRAKAVEKGVIDAETASTLDERQCLNLVFLPGFSTKDEISSVSGRGVGMDVVKTNIHKLNGRIEVASVPGQGTTFLISLPLTLAILPVLVVRLEAQSFAVPLSLVREIIPINPKDVQRVSGKAHLVVRDEVLPIRGLAAMIGWPQEGMPAYGVLMQTADTGFILGVDGFVGRDDVVIKPLADIKPHGIAGATLSGDGSVVLVLDMEALLKGGASEAHAAGFVQA
jgi:two-component system chemotaxis sensor kinase CheA